METYSIGSKLYEASLGQVWKHADRGFFMMSAFRGNDDTANYENHDRLKADLKAAKLGFFEINGVYKYEDGTVGEELSMFVPYRELYSFDEFKRIAWELGEKYNQESVLLGVPHDGYHLLYTDGKEMKIGDKLGFDKVGDAYSALRKGSHKGRSFVVESYDIRGRRIPLNHISAIGLKSLGFIF